MKNTFIFIRDHTLGGRIEHTSLIPSAALATVPEEQLGSRILARGAFSRDLSTLSIEPTKHLLVNKHLVNKLIRLY